MRKTIISIFAALALCFTLNAQDARQRTVETIVQDVLAALPTDNLTDCYVQMADLAKAAPASVEMLAAMLQPAEAGANNLVEYAIAGVTRYATDPANAAVKENVKKGLVAAAAACKDKYNKQFLESQVRLMTPPATYAEFDPIDVKAVSKSKTSIDKCKVLWALSDNQGAKSAKAMLAALKDQDRAVRTTALFASEPWADDAFYAQVAKSYKKLSKDAKVDVLTWFGDNKVASQLDLMIAEMKNEGAVAEAAIEAVAMVGGDKAADALLAVPVTKENINALRNALNFVNVDLTEKVVKILPSAEGVQQGMLLSIASDKRIYETAPEVMKLVKAGNETAKDVLAGVVTPADFPEVAALLDAEKEKVNELAKAAVASLKTLPADEQFAQAKAAADKASNPVRLYSAIAKSNTDDAVAYLKGKYEAGSNEALGFLASMRNVKVAPVLLAAADQDQKYIRAFVNVVGRNIADKDRLCAEYVKALNKATDTEAKKVVINALGKVPTMSAFVNVGNYLDDQNLAYTAAVATKAIANANSEELDYYVMKTNLTKAAEIYRKAGGSDDGYAVDEINHLLANLKPFEKSVLTEEEAKLGFEMLFDGTDLSKWVGDKVGYTPVNGCIQVTASYGDAKNLYTEKEYSDFVFRFEFCFTKPGVNNGVGIRTPMGVDAAYHGMCEVQVLDHDAPIYKNLREYQVHGSVYGIVPAKRIVHKPLGEWSTMEIRVVGETVKVTVNGEVITEANVREACQGHNVAPEGETKNPYTVDHKNHPGLFNKKGHIGFLGHGAGLKYRNVRVLDLSAKK